MEVYCENPADPTFVDVDAERESDLLSDSLAAPTAIPPFHFDDRIDQFFWSALWDQADGLGWGKTATGTFAGSAFCENPAESRSLRRLTNAKHAPDASAKCTDRP
jgi:hypothetical protein